MTSYLTPLETAKIILGISLHFKSDKFDASKYNFKTQLTQASYDKRKDKYFFAKIAKKYINESTIRDYAIGNLVEAPGLWVGKFDENNYIKWRGRLRSLEYRFEKDLKELVTYCGGVGNALMAKEGEFPEVYNLWLQDKITAETITILESQTQFTKKIKVPIELWSDRKRLIEKYHLLLRWHKAKFSNITKQYFK